MADSDNYKPPEASRGDAGHAIARSIIGAIPFAGAAGIELLGAIVQPPLERRKKELFEEMGEALQKLETERGLNLEDLRDNEIFIDVVIQATQAALRTSQEEKRTALRNAIMNSALVDAPDEDRQNFFIRLVDEFSAFHLRVLKIYSDPWKWAKESGEDVSHIVVGDREEATVAKMLAFSGDSDQLEFNNQIWRDIYLRGLVSEDSMNNAAVWGKASISQLGREFLRYIEEPQ